MRDPKPTTALSQLLRSATAMWRLPRAEFWREVITATALLGILLLIELVGRWNASEGMDAAAGLVLVLCIAMVVSWHRRLRLRWTRKVQLQLRQVILHLRSWRFDWGLDLRCEPAVPRGCPPLLRLLPLTLLAICATAVLWASLVGMPLREPVANVSFVIYAGGLIMLWAGLLGVMLISAFLPAWTTLDMVKSHTNLSERKAARVGIGAALVYFALVLTAALLLPVWVATLLLAFIAIVAVALPWAQQTWYPDCLWRGNTTDREVRSISLGTLFSLQLLVVALIPLTLVLLCLGPEALALSEGYAEAPASRALGSITAWLSSGGLFVFLGLLALHMGIARRHDPSRHAGTSLHIAGVSDRVVQTRIAESLARQRWNVRFAPREPQRHDVTVQIGEADAEGIEQTQDESGTRATFRLTSDELQEPQVLERLARRDVIQRRRMLTKGLESIFRRAARRKNRKGSGYWVAPHLWFVDGLTRDQFDDEDTNVLDVIPPLYYKAFPRAARQHFFEVSRALKFDLVYVEDGVNFRNFRRVLRVLFERFDIDGGRQPLSDIHFAGLPKVRVMLHDYDFEEPPLKTKYPEPDYQHLGRVRILHVFRDRGDEEEQAITPEEPDWLFTPDDSPVLVG